MERMIKSSDLWPDVTAAGQDGLERTWSIGLEVTYDFNPTTRRMAISVRGLPHGVESRDGKECWLGVYHSTADRRVVSAWVGFIWTARELTKLLGLPDTAAFAISGHLQKMADRLQPFVEDCFCFPGGDICVPEKSAVAGPTLVPEGDYEGDYEEARLDAEGGPLEVRGNVLIQVDRDISGIFNRPEGTCLLQYTLFSEPSLFRCVIAAFDGNRRKVYDFNRKEVISIIKHLEGDELAMEIADHFVSPDSHLIHLVGTVLKYSFARLTRPPAPLVEGPEIPRLSESDAPTVCVPVATLKPGDTIPLVPVDPDETVTVYNGGYFPLRG